MACIDVDVDEYLYDASEKALRREIAERVKEGRWKGDLPHFAEEGVHPWTTLGIADDLRNTFYSRNASRFEAVVALLENEERPFRPRLKVAA